MATALSFTDVVVRRDDNVVINGLDWLVKDHERWAVLGPNGSGKTTLLKIAGAQLHPSSGRGDILGHTLGRFDLRELRKQIGFVSGAVNRSLRHDLLALDIVVTGKDGALEPWWSQYSDNDYVRARGLLDELGVVALTERPFAVVSEGERQQILLARALMGDPKLLLLDEPFAGLDLGARERLLQRLAVLMADPLTPPSILITHHAEELPDGITHVGLLRAGQWVVAGPIHEVLTSANVSACFDLDVELEQRHGRYFARTT